MRVWLLIGAVALAGCFNRNFLGVDVALQVTPQSLPADGNSFANVSVYVVGGGDPVPADVGFTLQSTEPNATIVQFGAPDPNGWRYARISSLVPGTQGLSVTVAENGATAQLPFSTHVTFTALAPPGPQPSATYSSLVANPNLVSDDGQTASTLTLRVLDGNGNPVPAAPVAFTSTGTNNFFSIGSGLTDLAGLFTTTLASTTPEVKTVTANVGSIALSTQVTFSPVGASPLFSTLQANPNVVTADGASTSVLTLVLRDTAGLPLPGALVTWTSTGTNNTFSVGSSTTDMNGQATTTLASTTAQIKTVTATSGAVQLSQALTFVAGPANALRSTLVANPNLVPADNSSTSLLTFTVLDAYGNPVANVPVTFTSSGSHNTLTPAGGATNASGVVTATLASSTAENKTVTASSSGFSVNQTVTFLAGPPNQTSSVIVVNPNLVTADGTSTATITVTLTDTFGNPTPGQAVTFSSTGANNAFFQPVGTANAAGQMTTTVTSTTAEISTIIAAFSTGSVSTEVTFVNGPPSSTMTTLTASPTTVTADGSTTTSLTVVVEDAYGNPVGGQSVVLSSSGANNVFSASSGTTTLTGEFTATMSSATAQVKTITVTAGSATATASVTFVAGPVSSTTTALVASPTTVTADGTSQSTLTVTVEDAHGNPVVNQAVSIASTGSNNTLSPAAGSTNSAGVFTATLASTKAEAKNLTATIGGVTKTGAVTFVPGAPSSATTTLIANPNTVTANNTSTTALTLTLLDAQGNPIANQAVSLSSTGSNNVFGGATGTTNSAGVYSTTLASSTAEVKTVTATAGSFNATTTVTFIAGPPTSAHCTLTANPTALTANGNSTTQLTFVVQDAFGNPVVNQAVTLSSTGSNNTFSSAAGTTNSSGQFITTMASTKAEAKTVTGTAGAAIATITVTFNPGPVSSATTTLVINPNTLAADGSSTATLLTTALDAQGNPVPSQSVSLSASGTNNTITPSSGSTSAAGTFSATLSSTTVQTETVSALVAGSVTTNANVTFTTPQVSVTNSTIVASPNSLTANGTATTTITVTVLNSSNAPVQNAPVVMTATGTANTFAPASGTTNTSGVFTTTLASTQSGLKTVTATVEGTALNTNVTFLAGSPNGTTTTLVASPNTVTADGASHATLTVLVKDAYGNPVPNQAVSLALSGGNNTLSPASGNTDATGTFTATLASTLAQTETVTATVGSFNETTTVTFVPGTVSGVTTTFVANPNSATANGVSAITLTATVRDAEGNLVPNQSVVLSSTGSNNTFTPPSGSTNGAGVFTSTITSTMAQAKTITATIGTVNENANVVFVAGPAASTTSTLVLTPTSVTANGNTTTVKVTVQDANGNAVANQNVTLAGSGTANTFTPASGPTNASGIFTATLSSTVAQVENITATVGVVNLTASMTFTAGSPNTTLSTLTASPTSLVANGVTTTTLTVTVKDAEGNPVPSQAVSLSSNGTANTISPLSGSTNPSGVFTATFASTTAQIKLVTATIGTVNETANVTFTAGAPSNANTTFVASPTSVTADGVSTSTLTVTVADQYGNPVPNQGVTFSSSGSANTFGPAASGTTNASGVFTATLASTTAQIKALTATVGSLAPIATVTFVAGAPATATSSVGVAPGIVTANGTSTTTVTVTVKDTYGNLVANQAVSVSANGSANTWSATNGTSGSTNASGIWTTTLASTVAQNENITATIGTVTELTTISFVAGPASSGTSSLSASPTSLTADNSSTTSLQITVEDAQGNPVSGQSVTFSSNGTGATFNTTTCSTTTSGLCSVTLKSSVAQPVTVTANFAGVTKTTTVTFVAGPATGTTSSLTASPTSLPDDGTSTTTLQVTVEDTLSNPINAQPVTFSSSGSGYTFSATTCSTNTSGICSVTMKSTAAGAVVVTAAFAGVTKTANVTFTTGAANGTTSSLSASPSSVADDGVAPSTLQISVDDATSNPVTGQAVTFSSTGTGYSFSSTTCTTAASGLCTVTLKSTVAQTVIVTAAFAGFNKTANVTFSTGPAAGTTSFLTASPNSLADDGNATSTLLITVEDATGNPVTGQAVTFSSTGSGYTFSATTCATATNGQCSVTLKSTVAQTVTITANFGGASTTTNVTFVTGAPVGTTSFLTASPNTLADDGVAASTVQISVSDLTGNPVNAQAVTFSSNGTGTTFSATTCTTNASGVCSVTLKDTAAQTVTVTANFAGLSKTTNIIFLTGPTANATSALSASPTSLADDGVATSTLLITVNDATNNPVTGQAVTFAASPTTGTTFSASTCATATNGQCSVTLKSTTAETVQVTATFAGFSKTANVTFVTGNASNANSSLTASPSSLPDDGVTTSALQITVKDATGNLVNGQAVTFASSGGGSAPLSSTTCTTASGVCSVTMKSAVAQMVTVTATFAGLSKTAAVTFVTGAATSATSFLTASPNSVADDGVATSTLQVTVEDATGNPITGQNVTFSSAGSALNFSSTTCTTSGGICSVTLASTVAQAITVNANFAGAAASATVTFVTGAPNAGRSSLTASPNSLPDDGVTASTLQISVEDLTGNPVNAQAVTFSTVGTGYTFSATTCNTTSSGLCSVTLKSTKAQTLTVTAAFAGLNEQATVTFTIGNPNGTLSTLVASPNTLTADGATTSNLTVTAEDGTGNLINNQAVTFSAVGTNYHFSATTGTTTAGSLSVTLTSTKAQVVTVTAGMGGTNVTANVTFTAGSPNSIASSLVANPNSLPADGTTTSTLTVTVDDMYGNPVPNQIVTFTGLGTNNSFSSPTGTTNASGQTSVTLKTTTAQTEPLTAATGAMVVQTSITFTAGSPNNTKSTLLANPTTVTADGTSWTVLTVTIDDAFSNPVAGQAVTFASNGTGNAFPSGSTATTNSGGQAAVTMTSTKAQVKNATATAGATINLAANVTFVAGPPASATLTANPNVVTNNGTATTVLTLTLLDAYSNPVANQAATFAGSGSGNAFAPASTGTTNSVGVFTAALSSSTSQAEVITGSGGSASANVNVWFVGNPNTTKSKLTVNPTSVIADGTHASTITFSVKDAWNTPIPNQAVTLTASGNSTYFAAATGTTDAFGNYVTTVTSFKAQTETITGTAGTATASATLTFTAATCTFAAAASYNAGRFSYGFTSADVNGDNWNDLIVANYGADTIGVLTNKQNGTFNAMTTPLSLGVNPVIIAAADFDKNGKVDIVFMANPSNNVYFYSGAGNGTFSTMSTITLSSQPTYISVADVNGDGSMDVVLGTHGSAFAYLKNNGSGTFTATYPSVGSGVLEQVVAIDINKDGNVDLLGSNTSNFLDVILATSAGTFGSVSTYATAASTAAGLAVADFNGDGFPDAAVSLNSGTAVNIFINQGDGTFNSSYTTVSGTGTQPIDMVPAYFLSSNKVDLLLAVAGSGAADVIMGNGDGTFQAPIAHSSTSTPSNAVVADDWNKDGKVDFAVADENGSGSNGYITVYLSTGCN